MAASVAVQAKGASDARKAANAAANAKPNTVDINALDAQARQISARNAAEGAALEQIYNPGAAQLRADSLQNVIAGLSPNEQTNALLERIYAQAGTAPDSPLLRAAIAQAQRDLAQGGAIPVDVQNAVTRRALAQTGQNTGNLGLGRDVVARDLGLTSLDLMNRRLQNAASLGQAEAGLSSDATANLFNSANLLNSISGSDFARQLAAAQLGQSIQMPQTGLDPSAVANLAVGNSNSANAQQQQGFALRAGAANQMTQLGGQMMGAGASMYGGMMGNLYGGAAAAGNMCWVAREVYSGRDDWIKFRDWLLSSGSPEFVEFYRENGHSIAENISGNDKVKELIRHLMDSIIKGR